MGSRSRDGATSGKSQGGGGGGGGSGQEVKKGPWTTAEDTFLIEYVRKHGEGNWNAIQRNSGLLRCGKSCRLRWANHLRPNLKKGAFSPEEERLIIELHAKLGNKWARMASQLPGRTDNEIKNYWNTRVKRLQRTGLPIYPDNIPQQHDQPQLQQRHPNSSSASFSSWSSLYSNSKFNPSLSLLNSINFPTMENPFKPGAGSSFLSHPNHQFKLFCGNERSSNFSLPLTSSISPFSSSPSSLFSQSFQSELFPAYPIQFKVGDFNISPSPTIGGSFNPLDLVPITETELPSIQSPTSSGTTGGDYMIETPSNFDGYCIAPEPASSGLLEALLEESKTLAHAENLKREKLLFAAGKGKEKCVSDLGLTKHAASGLEDTSSTHSSVALKRKEPLEEMDHIEEDDDDLSSLLNNFPLTLPSLISMMQVQTAQLMGNHQT